MTKADAAWAIRTLRDARWGGVPLRADEAERIRLTLAWLERMPEEESSPSPRETRGEASQFVAARCDRCGCGHVCLAAPPPPGPDPRSPVCSRCDDTHAMSLNGILVPCTACPTPCQKCRAGGNGAYCEKTPCDCECHKASSPTIPGPARCPYHPTSGLIRVREGEPWRCAACDAVVPGREAAR